MLNLFFDHPFLQGNFAEYMLMLYCCQTNMLLLNNLFEKTQVTFSDVCSVILDLCGKGTNWSPENILSALTQLTGTATKISAS